MFAAALVDEFPAVQKKDLVQLVELVTDPDSDEVVGEPGDLAWIDSKSELSLPTIYIERTNSYVDAHPNQFVVLAEEGFANSPETTPSAARTEYLRRAVTVHALPLSAMRTGPRA